MKPVRAMLVAAFTLVCAAHASAQKAPVVAVKFSLREKSYQTEYGAQVPMIERSFAKFLATRLAQQMAYIRFDTVTGAPRTLVVSLDRKDPGSNAPRHEIGLYVRFAEGATAEPEQYWVMFRPIDQYLARRGSAEQLLNELRVRFNAGDLEALQTVLRNVPVASQAALWRDPLAWILPFKRGDLCMDVETTLLVRSSIESSAGPLHDAYIAKANREFKPATAPAALRNQVGNVMGSLTSQRGDLDALRAATPGSIKVEGIFVDHYHRSESACAAPASPDSIPFTAGRP